MFLCGAFLAVANKMEDWQLLTRGSFRNGNEARGDAKTKWFLS